MITAPLNIVSKLSRPSRSFDWFFYINIAALGLIFAILGSKFVMAPGMPVDLPSLAAPTENADIAGLMVNLQRDNLVLFDGGIHSMAAFAERLAATVQKNNGAPTTLLVRADKQVSVQGLATLCEIARRAGVTRVQIAAMVTE